MDSCKTLLSHPAHVMGSPSPRGPFTIHYIMVARLHYIYTYMHYTLRYGFSSTLYIHIYTIHYVMVARQVCSLSYRHHAVHPTGATQPLPQAPCSPSLAGTGWSCMVLHDPYHGGAVHKHGLRGDDGAAACIHHPAACELRQQ